MLVFAYSGQDMDDMYDASCFVADPSRPGTGPGGTCILSAARLTGKGKCNLSGRPAGSRSFMRRIHAFATTIKNLRYDPCEHKTSTKLHQHIYFQRKSIFDTNVGTFYIRISNTFRRSLGLDEVQHFEMPYYQTTLRVHYARHLDAVG